MVGSATFKTVLSIPMTTTQSDSTQSVHQRRDEVGAAYSTLSCLHRRCVHRAATMGRTFNYLVETGVYCDDAGEPHAETAHGGDHGQVSGADHAGARPGGDPPQDPRCGAPGVRGKGHRRRPGRRDRRPRPRRTSSSSTTTSTRRTGCSERCCVSVSPSVADGHARRPHQPRAHRGAPGPPRRRARLDPAPHLGSARTLRSRAGRGRGPPHDARTVGGGSGGSPSRGRVARRPRRAPPRARRARHRAVPARIPTTHQTRHRPGADFAGVPRRPPRLPLCSWVRSCRRSEASTLPRRSGRPVRTGPVRTGPVRTGPVRTGRRRKVEAAARCSIG